MEPLVFDDADSRIPVVIGGQQYHLSRYQDLTARQARGLIGLYRGNDEAVRDKDPDKMTDVWIKLLLKVTDIPAEVLEDLKMEFLGRMISAHLGLEGKSDGGAEQPAGA